MCVPWELNPQPFALLTQCSTTEPQEHTHIYIYIYIMNIRIRYIIINRHEMYPKLQNDQSRLTKHNNMPAIHCGIKKIHKKVVFKGLLSPNHSFTKNTFKGYFKMSDKAFSIQQCIHEIKHLFVKQYIAS